VRARVVELYTQLYALLYAQNGECIVTTDAVTSFHPMYSSHLAIEARVVFVSRQALHDAGAAGTGSPGPRVDVERVTGAGEFFFGRGRVVTRTGRRVPRPAEISHRRRGRRHRLPTSRLSHRDATVFPCTGCKQTSPKK